MKPHYLLTALAALLSFCVCTPRVYADHICSVEVSYTWQKKMQEEEAEESSKKKKKQNIEESKPKKVLFKKLSVTGKDEPLAKQKAKDKGKEELSAADLQCNKLHEDLAGCMAAKFHASRSVLQTLSFKARKDLEDAIVEGCKGQEGVCGISELSEPRCREKLEEPEGEDAGTEEGTEEKK
ncbi:MAG: hypothetical protein KDD62_04550 [Bdellovibrionales bacterium]|nr:hypothetical protein [Bdellovibrionales bacterium]